MTELFVWGPDRDKSFTCIASPPTDDTGLELRLCNGTRQLISKGINLLKEDTRLVPDFLYDVGLLLFVSEKAHEVLAKFDLSGVTVHKVNLKDSRGNLLEKLFWLNVFLEVPLMDTQKSAFTTSAAGLRVEFFSVSEQRIPKQDLFLCSEISTPVFSQRTVSEIQNKRLTGADFTPLQGIRWP